MKTWIEVALWTALLLDFANVGGHVCDLVWRDKTVGARTTSLAFAAIRIFVGAALLAILLGAA